MLKKRIALVFIANLLLSVTVAEDIKLAKLSNVDKPYSNSTLKQLPSNKNEITLALNRLDQRLNLRLKHHNYVELPQSRSLLLL